MLPSSKAHSQHHHRSSYITPRYSVGVSRSRQSTRQEIVLKIWTGRYYVTL